MKNIILVEGKDDKAFIEYLIQGVDVKEFSVNILEGLSKDALTKRLASLKTGFLKILLKNWVLSSTKIHLQGKKD
jgi:hypothetical protein